VTYATFQRVLDHYRGGDWKADLIALTGDLVQDDSAQAYGHFAPLLKDFDTPVLCVPGNHDVPELMQRSLPGPLFNYCGVVDLGNWRIVGLSSYKPDSAGGRVDESELKRLDAAHADGQAEHLLVCLHHPPVAMDSDWLESVGMDNREAVQAALKRSNKIRGLLFGHVHQAVDTHIDEVRVWGTPSTCRQFKPGSRLFAVDDKPPAYRRVTLHDDGQIDAELVWVRA